MRAAVYWAPEITDPLHALGSQWLGRDAETGATLPQPDINGIAEVTADARGYGLHATLKPPFRLARPWSALCEAVEELAASLRPFALPPLAVRNLKGFLALRETAHCPPLHALADACVTELDAFRAPPDDAELARRRRAGLTAAQEANLVRHGYPYVLGEWEFHVTLTRRLDDAARADWQARIEAHLGTVAAVPRLVTELCLFTQASPGAPFLVAERFPLKGTA
jgi:putative phosphonate metabolism protein